MKVSSPVGDFPFVVERLTFKGGKVVVDGHMGGWPAHTELSATDVPRLLWVAKVPLAGAAALTMLGVWLLSKK